MNRLSDFNPNWATPPGATILDLLEEQGRSMHWFAESMHRDVHQVSRLVYGIEALDEGWAQNLAKTLGSTPGFWLRREKIYRDDLARLSEENDSEKIKNWLAEISAKDMIRFGWIKESKTRKEMLVSALAFFGATSIDDWRRRYDSILEAAAYRSSRAFESRPGAVAAWLRQGEIIAKEIECSAWNPKAFSVALKEARALTRTEDPNNFIPKLVDLFASCGVAVVIARAPSGCPASGATKFINAEKALMLLSFRYLADDQFWFTVFHEAGHLLLHTHDDLFLEGVETVHPNAEEQANEFAKSEIFTEAGLAKLEHLPINKFAIARLAKQLDISSGLIVGQLQEMKRIPFKHFNFMKTRYSWEND